MDFEVYLNVEPTKARIRTEKELRQLGLWVGDFFLSEEFDNIAVIVRVDRSISAAHNGSLFARFYMADETDPLDCDDCCYLPVTYFEPEPLAQQKHFGPVADDFATIAKAAKEKGLKL